MRRGAEDITTFQQATVIKYNNTFSQVIPSNQNETQKLYVRNKNHKLQIQTEKYLRLGNFYRNNSKNAPKEIVKS